MPVLSIYYLCRKFSKNRFNKGFKKMTLKTGKMTPVGWALATQVWGPMSGFPKPMKGRTQKLMSVISVWWWWDGRQRQENPGNLLVNQAYAVVNNRRPCLSEEARWRQAPDIVFYLDMCAHLYQHPSLLSASGLTRFPRAGIHKWKHPLCSQHLSMDGFVSVKFREALGMDAFLIFLLS